MDLNTLNLGKFIKLLVILLEMHLSAVVILQKLLVMLLRFPLYNSANTARDAGVPEDKILKTKKDVNNYFTK